MSSAYDTYQINIKRARNFIDMYNSVSAGKGPGRRNTLTTDILRAGVVFLHSTFEEYLRSVILDRKIEMLSADRSGFEKVLGNVNLVGDNSGKSSAQKYYLKEFWDFKDQTILNMVSNSLRDKIGDITFNDYSQIVASLKEVNIEFTTNFNQDGIVDSYIKRRHKIVHEADNNTTGGRGNYKARSINTTALNAWINAVDAMVQDIENSLSAI